MTVRTGWIAAALAVAVGVVSGCASTKVTSSWKAPEAASTKLEKVLVVAVVRQESTRRSLEEQLAAELEQMNAQPVASYQLLGERELSKDAVKAIVERDGFDSVLVTQYMGTDKELEYVPATYEDYFVGVAGPMTYQPAHVYESEKVKLETRLFDAKGGGKLIWSAATATTDPSTAEKEIPAFAQKITDQLQQDTGL